MSKPMRVKRGQPVAWLVYCPDGHEFDFITFTDEGDAKSKAMEFCECTEDGEWNVYPLFVGVEPIVVR